MSAPTLAVREVALYERDVHLRLPFRFGVVTLEDAPQAFAHVRVETADGRSAWGTGAELMVPKWFDKDPALTNEDNFDQLRLACALAAEAYRAAGARTAFGLTAATHGDLAAVGADRGLNALTAGFGGALLDRAVLDALCHLADMSFANAVRHNAVGLTPDVLTPDLADFDLDAFLAGLTPAESIDVRHTVGMVDPLTDADQAPGERLNDGLPETLEEVVAAYGHRYFKVKLRGEVAADIDRLRAIAAVLDRSEADYAISLDGNEQYDDTHGVLELWRAVEAVPTLERFAEAVMFIEQPIRRAAALERDVTALSAVRPVILDESDDSYDSFPLGRAQGYLGISSKCCKGLYKSILNAARCEKWSHEGGVVRPFMTAEDLTCQAGASVQQDLALVALLGIDHVERNGHHYVHGMAGAPAPEQDAFLAAHPDLYRQIDGRACLRIAEGRLALGSLGGAGFALGAAPDFDAMRAMASPDPRPQ